MAIHGTVTAFDQSQEDFSSYDERLDHSFVANEVTRQEKVNPAVCMWTSNLQDHQEFGRRRQLEH